MTPTIAAWIWVAGIVAWFVLRYPHRKKAKKMERRGKTIGHRRSTGEWIALTLCILGLVVIPTIYLLTGIPAFADYTFVPALGWLGAIVMLAFLFLFASTHNHLSRNWSVTLELRTNHKLVHTGPYARIRHPMYSAFFLWGLAQAMLIPNWIAGLAGIASVAWLYFSRVGEEEAMLKEHFGEPYERYIERTGRLFPKL